MEIAAKLSIKDRFSAKKDAASPTLLKELTDLKLQLDIARSQFDILTDDAMIEACCYQMKSLSARYSRLLREARQTGLQNPPCGMGFPSRRKWCIIKLPALPGRKKEEP